MTSARSRLGLFLLLGILLTTMTAPATRSATDKYLTSSITQSGIKQGTVHGYSGVIVNYTNTYSSAMGSFVYVDVINSAGQTIYWNLGYCAFGANQLVQCFVPISSIVPHGNYTAWVFATTNSSIPLSLFSSVKVTV